MKFIGTETTDLRKPGMPVIKVIGLGGGGGNAVDYMVRSNVEGVQFICANTDAQALEHSPADICLQLGENGLGAGADPEKGKQAAKADIEKVKETLRGADMVFITAGMGGGTGTGSAPVVAQAAREMGILTVGVVSKPFGFERRNKVADAGIEELAEHVDSLITVPNDKLLKVLGRDFVLAKAFDYANEVLYGAVQGISELVTRPGMINVDFEDLRTVMGERGMAMMGVGHAKGDDRAIKAAEKAIANPLLDNIAVSGAKGLLVNITSGLDFTLGEFNEVGDVIDQVAAPDARVIIGTSLDESMTEDIRVTVVATGLVPSDAISTKPQFVKTATSVEAPAPKLEAEPVIEAVKSEPAFGSTDSIKPDMLAEPELVRPKMAVNGSVAPSAGSGSSYLDIPAFLRRQAD
ncbi:MULTISPECIES: cell division protein FtsZ [Thiomicrorhabdus]|uniref:Cell division protein FtsZ n=1 Tax=Thiomicrorhabdus heinhorstiae TaxID=2748010 RepID=A0ABS0BXN2_9GAMM|nr:MULTISPECIES: cell division protein FtsZ [Thiomicrorhabdus]MBF6058556.1 cell division protein FtsZ [Thiomicrorhabdus heinhorstiae]